MLDTMYISDRSFVHDYTCLKNNGEYAEIECYINVTDRKSRLIRDRQGNHMKESISEGAFRHSLSRHDKDVYLDIDHNSQRIVASGDHIALSEDKIGLKMYAIINDIPLIADILQGNIKGFSFSFNTLSEKKEKKELYYIRNVLELVLNSVSIIVDKNPVYKGNGIVKVYVPDMLRTKAYEVIAQKISRV